MIEKNAFNIDEALIDGGIICNNPSLYAYYIAHYLRDKRGIRMISIGTGVPKSEIKSHGNEHSVKSYSQQLSKIFEFMMDIEVASANIFMKSALNENYVRLNTANDIGSTDNSKAAIKTMIEEGDKMWNEPLDIHQTGIETDVNEEAKKLIRDIIDERYGPGKGKQG